MQLLSSDCKDAFFRSCYLCGCLTRNRCLEFDIAGISDIDADIGGEIYACEHCIQENDGYSPRSRRRRGSLTSGPTVRPALAALPAEGA